MTKHIPARPAHPTEPPPLHPFCEANEAWLDATASIRQSEWLASAWAIRPPLPAGHGLSF
jgi:hypothetical protein